MADAKALVRHPSGHPAGIAAADTLVAPAFKATNAGGATVDANNGKVINVAAGSATTDAVNKSQLDTAVAGRVPTSRLVNAGQGLIGGGNLGADITLNIALAANSGLVLTADAIGVDFGTGTNQVARGDHGHAGVYQPKNNELDALASLPDTAGLVRKTGDGSYEIDTNAYLTSLAHSHTITAGNGLSGGGSLGVGGTVTINVGAGAGIAVSADTVAVKGDQTKGIVVDSVAGVQARIGTGLKFRTADGAIEAEGTGAIQPGGDGTNGIALITSGQSLNQLDDMLHVHGVEFVPGDTYWLLDGDPVYASAAALNKLVDGGSADDLHTHSETASVWALAKAGEALAAGDAVAIDPADGKVYKASNASNRAGFVGFVSAPVALDGTAKISQIGALNIPGVSTVGQYWLGTTPGVLVNAPPATGRQVRVGFKSTDNFIVAIADFGEV